MLGEHSQSERRVRVTLRSRLAEEKSAGFLPLCCREARRRGSKREGGVENTRERGAAGARERRCPVPASMQERELRKGSVRRCGEEGPGSNWPSAAGANPAASFGVPPEMPLDCKPVRGKDVLA
eukprot:1517663-Pleurochrysis_carterae.AAC.2